MADATGTIQSGAQDAMLAELFNNSEGLVMGLHTDSSLTESDDPTVLGETNYSPISLTTGIAVSGGQVAIDAQDFTATGGAFVSNVYGYYISKSGTFVLMEVDAAAPYTVAEDETYQIDLSVTGD